MEKDNKDSNLKDVKDAVLETMVNLGVVTLNQKEERGYTIDYTESYKNNFKTDVKKAVKFYLELYEDFKYSEEDFCGFILYPQALNPFLKMMETMGESKNIIILPAYNQDDYDNINLPAYLIIKIDGELKFVNSFKTTRV